MNQERMPLNVASKSIVSWSMTHRARSCRQSGFSLVEVTIAVGLFAFVMLPIIGLMSSGLGTMRRAMDDTVLSGIAREIVAEAQRENWNNLARFNGETFYYTDEGVRAATEAEANGGFVAQVALANPPSLLPADNSTARLLRVTVRHFADPNNRLVRSELLVNTMPQ
jgi:uncharacterized protein (TIGR02598 family)